MKKLLEVHGIKKFFALLATFAIVQVLISANIINDYLQATLVTICINIVLSGEP